MVTIGRRKLLVGATASAVCVSGCDRRQFAVADNPATLSGDAVAAWSDPIVLASQPPGIKPAITRSPNGNAASVLLDNAQMQLASSKDIGACFALSLLIDGLIAKPQSTKGFSIQIRGAVAKTSHSRVAFAIAESQSPGPTWPFGSEAQSDFEHAFDVALESFIYEHGAAGARFSLPITIVAAIQRPRIDDSVLVAVDSIDIGINK